MKLQVLQENLTKALSITTRFTNIRAQLPVLGNVLISAQKNKLLISATNLENSVSLTIGAKVEKEGEITIPAKTFNDTIVNLNPGTVNLQSEKEKLTLSTSNFNSTLAGMNPSDFPSVPQTVGKSTLVLSKKKILEALNCVLFAVSSDETRPVLTGVLFILKGKELVVVATDGFRLSQKKIRINFSAKELSFILPKNILSELLRLVGESEEINLSYKESESQVVFGIDNLILASRTIEGEFPDFNKIIPHEFKIKLSLDREEFLQAVKLASVFARDSANVIKMIIKNDSLKVFAESSQVGKQETKL